MFNLLLVLCSTNRICPLQQVDLGEFPTLHILARILHYEGPPGYPVYGGRVIAGHVGQVALEDLHKLLLRKHRFVCVEEPVSFPDILELRFT